MSLGCPGHRSAVRSAVSGPTLPRFGTGLNRSSAKESLAGGFSRCEVAGRRGQQGGGRVDLGGACVRQTAFTVGWAGYALHFFSTRMQTGMPVE